MLRGGTFGKVGPDRYAFPVEWGWGDGLSWSGAHVTVVTHGLRTRGTEIEHGEPFGSTSLSTVFQ